MRGHFGAHVWIVAQAVLCTVLCLPAIASADIGDNAAGINVHVPAGAPHLLEKARSLGVRWVRVDGNWELFEGRRDVADVPENQRTPQAAYSEDEYTWGLMDGVVCEATARDLEVFMTLAYTPCWAIEGGGVNCNDPNRGYSGFRKPIRGKYEAFVFAAVRHYSEGIDCGGRTARVTHFGMWNEANLEQFYENGDVADYTSRLLVPGARAVKAACPDCKVLGPDLAHVGEADDKLETILCDPQGRAAIDILSHHSYNDFEELGHFIWDGDSYDNVLDEQRFPFTRRSLRQIMEMCQATDKEVWMTETGLRAPGAGPFDNPSFDQDELDDQATYTTLVLRAQAQRPWVTNTFIYEIVDDTFSDINGYGLWRCDQNNGIREPCFEKPAAQAMRDFIDAHPEFRQDTPQPDPACSNGRDDDEDGLIDFPADPGCDSAEDRDEFNPPPPPAIDVPRAPGPISVDGSPDEYGEDGVVLLAGANFEAVDAAGPPGPGDLSASIRIRRVGDRIAFFVEVVDDVHDNSLTPPDLWQGDSLQLAFDPEQNGGDGYSGQDVELGMALQGNSPEVLAFFGQRPGLEGPAILRSGGRTLYEFTLPVSALFGRGNVGPGDEAFASLLINEADREGREGWLAFGGGIGRFKRPADFARLRLVDRDDDPGPDPEPDMQPDPDPTPNPDPTPDMNPDPQPGADVGMDADDQMDAEGPEEDANEPGDDSAMPDNPEDETPGVGTQPGGGGAQSGCQVPVGGPGQGALWWLMVGLWVVFSAGRRDPV